MFQLKKVETLAQAEAALRAVVDRIEARGVPLGSSERALVAGLLRGHDPHSELIPPDELARLRGTAPSGGLGVTLAIHGGRVTVREVLDGTPADGAGLRPGDVLLSVDAASTAGLPADAVGRKLAGAPDVEVALEVERGGARLAVKARRAPIRLPSAQSKLVGGVGWGGLAEFGSNAAADVAAAVDSLVASGAKAGLVLDLRGNPGGLVDQAVQVADLFLDGGLVVETSSARAREPRRARPGVRTKLPLVVLVDEETASAAEIVAGALRLQKRAALVGARTFGKGTVQVVHDLPGGWGVKLTVAEYRLENGYRIRGQGLAPDLALAPVRVLGDRTLGFAPSDLGEERLGDRLASAATIRAIPYLARDEDPLPSLAARALAAGPKDHAALLAALRREGEKLADAEAPRLAKALAPLGVDWSAAPGVERPPLALEAVVEEDGRLRIVVANRGEKDAHRVRLWTRSAVPALDRHEVVVGRLAAGARHEVRLALPLPDRHAPRVRVHVEAEADGTAASIDPVLALSR